MQFILRRMFIRVKGVNRWKSRFMCLHAAGSFHSACFAKKIYTLPIIKWQSDADLGGRDGRQYDNIQATHLLHDLSSSSQYMLILTEARDCGYCVPSPAFSFSPAFCQWENIHILVSKCMCVCVCVQYCANTEIIQEESSLWSQRHVLQSPINAGSKNHV